MQKKKKKEKKAENMNSNVLKNRWNNVIIKMYCM